MVYRTLGLCMLVASMLLAGCAGTTPGGEPPQAPEPARLEERVYVTLGDDFMADASGAKGGTFQVPANKTVGIHVRNVGAVTHEVMFGRTPIIKNGAADGFEESLFEEVGADVFVYQPAKTEVATAHGLEEIEVGAGGQVRIRTKFPEAMRGEWEIGCFVPGHFEEGMKARLVIG